MMDVVECVMNTSEELLKLYGVFLFLLADLISSHKAVIILKRL